MEELFLFGQEFEAILDDEELEDEFTATAKDVSSKYPNFGLVSLFNALKFT